MADRFPPVHAPQQGLRALLLCVLLALGGCDQRGTVHSLSGPTMGTTWSVKIVAAPGSFAPPTLQRDLEAVLESINRQMSTYRTDSDISAYNRAAAGTWHRLPPDFYRVLEYSLGLARETRGGYDPTVGPLVNLWGFGPEEAAPVAPSREELEAVRARVGWHKVRLDPARRAALQPGGLYLDLSSVAKGYAVDKLGDYLRGRGFAAWLVEVGGELRASGMKPDGSAWRVAIEQPLVEARLPGTVLALQDISIATSGDYRNFRELDGRHFAHIIDPRTGWPVSHGLVSVSVLAETCTEADALATALTVLGPEEGMRFAQERQLAVLMIVKTPAGFREVPSPAFRALVDAEDRPS